MSNSLPPHGVHHTRLPCPSSSPGVCSNSCPLSQWCHPTISSSFILFLSCLQSFLTSGSLLMSQLFTSGDQSIGASVSTSVLPMNIQGWFLLGLTGLSSLQFKNSQEFSNTTIPKHGFFCSYLYLWSNSLICTWLGGKPWESVCLQCGRPGFNPGVGKIPWRRKWQPTPVLLPGKFHGLRILAGYSPGGHKELDTTEQLNWTDSYARNIKTHKEGWRLKN